MKDEAQTRNGVDLAGAFEGSSRRILAVDVQKYQFWLDGSDLSAEQKEEFLRAVWSVVVTFVELGFGVHPLEEVCGKERKALPQAPKRHSIR